jgi:hypothetical protein
MEWRAQFNAWILRDCGYARKVQNICPPNYNLLNCDWLTRRT